MVNSLLKATRKRDPEYENERAQHRMGTLHGQLTMMAKRVTQRTSITEMAGAVIVILLAQAGAVAQVPAGWLGTWKLNVVKSTTIQVLRRTNERPTQSNPTRTA
jgi:hypothetical protein